MLDDAERGAVQQVERHASADVLIVLVAALKVLHVRCQVRVDEAEAGVVENKPHRHTSFVSLQGHHTPRSMTLVMKYSLIYMQTDNLGGVEVYVNG